MEVRQLTAADFGIDPLRGKCKEGTGWKTDKYGKVKDPKKYKYYCMTCYMEIRRPYHCKNERELNKSVYTPTNPNWKFNRPPSLKPRCPACKELDKTITRQQRIDMLQGNINGVKEEGKRLIKHKKKWKKFRKKHGDLIFKNPNLVIDRHALRKIYKPGDMWQNHTNLTDYMRDEEGYLFPRDEETKPAVNLLWELHHTWKLERKQADLAYEYKMCGNIEFRQKNYEKAFNAFSKAIKCRVDNPELYILRAKVTLAQGKYSNCIFDCNVVIVLIDEFHTNMRETDLMVLAYLTRAKAKKGQGKLDGAKKDLEIGLKIMEDDIDARHTMECKQVLSEVNTLILLNKDGNAADSDEKDISLDEDELLFRGALEFLKTGEDKTSESEEQLFPMLSKLLFDDDGSNKKSKNHYLDRFLNKENGFILSLNYLRSKFKYISSLKDKSDLNNPGCDVLFAILNSVLQSNKINAKTIKKSLKIIAVDIVYCFAFFLKFNDDLQFQSMQFASHLMTKMTDGGVSGIVCGALVNSNFSRKIYRNFLKITKSHKKINLKLDVLLIDCTTALLNNDKYNEFVKDKARQYDIYQVMCLWMAKYCVFINKKCDKGVIDEEYEIVEDMLIRIIGGMARCIKLDCLVRPKDIEKNMGYLIEYFDYLKKLKLCESGGGNGKKSEGDDDEKSNVKRATKSQVIAVQKIMLLFANISQRESTTVFLLKYPRIYTNLNGLIALAKSNETVYRTLRFDIKSYFSGFNREDEHANMSLQELFGDSMSKEEYESVESLMNEK